MRRILFAIVLSAAAPVAAQDTPVEPGGSELTEPPPATACVPACRPGFVCVNGTCVSACNPPCPTGQVCTAELQCIGPAPTHWGSDPAASGPGEAGGPVGPPPAAESARIAFGPHLGFAGSAEGEIDLSPSPGAHLRVDVPVGPHVAVGGLVLFAALKPDFPGLDYEIFYLDVAFLIRIGASFGVGSGHLAVYGAVPFGFSANIGEGNDFFGFVTGILPGLQYFFNDRIGLLIEVGWLIHEYFEDGSEFGLHQGVLNAGVAILL